MVHCHNNYCHVVPCLHCHPHSYIRMVQHLIERCLLLHMNQQQCVKALAHYASIRPCITITVWRELEKENKDFFRAYVRAFSSYRLFMGRYIQRKPSLERKKQYWKH
ncbi:Plant-specific transcription factor YABBY family protein [Hibiscus syriacus]|uniref:Plant-specific transcription factor YABBY family protein n=1 Tax=Hibiscus syriacus TaxID=106335 RepID=A0A6A3AZI6_HIBSY|nr:uncharacterized protein LOC120118056 [Hibiscus syriacus]XP_038994134.1 uncharacterized protein LOC120118056 [Hibiscus syriacus]KAE8710214.1 Plant-specific transcription factor YABBY family protein [Hibiscus syriacus]